ncbi:MAG TPA: GAF domain-containing protein [Allosphingosinicella sp.]|nr:GAF domain-containing protein [Allosphingosinicella sp.]
MQASAFPQIDYTSCDKEPIHIPGATQPHGVLLIVESPGGPILQAAGPHTLLRCDTQSVLGKALAEVLGSRAEELLQTAAGLIDKAPVYVGSLSLPGAERDVDLLAHEVDGRLVVELESRDAPMPAAGSILAAGRRAAARIAGQTTVEATCNAVVQEVRALVGYDRVMVYRFLNDASGSVVAEARADSAKSYLNHRFPASDIPSQARELYVRNLARVIPDVGYVPQPLLGVAGDEIVLDMSNCLLRSISPIHIQYLKNMGVGASASFSVVKDGALWGLIACHHPARRLVPWEIRETCGYLAQSLSYQLRAQGAADRHSRLSASSRRRETLLAKLNGSLDVDTALIDHRSQLRQLIDCDGAAVVSGSTVKTLGSVPPAQELEALIDWLVHTGEEHCFSTRKLGQAFPGARNFQSPIKGMLAAVVDADRRVLVIWFRVEQIETVEWAGNPHKQDSSDPTVPLSPRHSFETWTEKVSGSSTEWQMEEIEAAEAFQAGLRELRQRRQLADLNMQLELALAAERKARAELQRLQAG